MSHLGIMCTSRWPGKSSVSASDQIQERKMAVANVEEDCSYNLVLFLLERGLDKKSRAIPGISVKKINILNIMRKLRYRRRKCKAPQELARGGSCHPTERGWERPATLPSHSYSCLTYEICLPLWNKNFALDNPYPQQCASKLPRLPMSSILGSWTYCSGFSGLLVKLTRVLNTVSNSTRLWLPEEDQWLWGNGDRERRGGNVGPREFYRKSKHKARSS